MNTFERTWHFGPRSVRIYYNERLRTYVKLVYESGRLLYRSEWKPRLVRTIRTEDGFRAWLQQSTGAPPSRLSSEERERWLAARALDFAP